MIRSKNDLLCLLIPTLALLIVVAGTAPAAVRVGGSAFFANGQPARDHQYTGACPVDLKFDWGLISTAPARVTYTVVRSDGGHASTPRSVALPPGRSVPVVEHWRLGARSAQFANFSGWMEIVVESPNPVTNRIPFTLHCR